MQVSSVNQDLGVSKPWRHMFMMRNIPGTPMSYFFRSQSLLRKYVIVRVVNQKEKTPMAQRGTCGRRSTGGQISETGTDAKGLEGRGKGHSSGGGGRGNGNSTAGRPAVFPIFLIKMMVLV